jgi:DNA-directed RNA polymerase subunit N (RpoN/RPB10)
MLYARCPSCGKSLSQLVIKYEEELKQICDNPSTSLMEKKTEKIKLINNLGLKRYCCKTRMLTFIDSINIII